MINLQLTDEEIDLLKETLGSNMYYSSYLDDALHQHPGDLIDWGKHMQLTGTILLKVREAQNAQSTIKKKGK
jgi:hypothetical protein